MIAKHLLPALVAVAGTASAQNSACSQKTFTVNSQADIRSLASGCQSLTGNVVVGTQTDSSLDFSGIQTVNGDFTVQNNGVLTSLKSSSLGQITGQLLLNNLTALSNLGFTSLQSVGTITFQALTALDSLNFGTSGVTQVKSVTVSDTFLSSLNGLNMQTVGNFDIDNNRRLVKYSSSLTNLTGNFIINANGLNFQVSLPNLVWAYNLTISNVTEFDVPSLQTVNGSMAFGSNFFTSFSAPNLTSTSSGDISFVSNPQLANITMPDLTSIGGGLLIANNTALMKVNGFNAVKTIGGAVKLRGSFNEVDFPALSDVKGAFDISSTADISSSCNTFNKLAPQSQGGGGQVEGLYNCTSNNANANSDTSAGPSGGGGNGNSAAGVAVNMAALLGLTAVGMLVQAMC